MRSRSACTWVREVQGHASRRSSTCLRSTPVRCEARDAACLRQSFRKRRSSSSQALWNASASAKGSSWMAIPTLQQRRVGFRFSRRYRRTPGTPLPHTRKAAVRQDRVCSGKKSKQ
eukprot:scaffold824_cov327-Pavlova_lutheri.AAC.5